MALLQGPMTLRRFRVEGDLPADPRDHLRDGLQAHAFPESATPQGGEEVEGWVVVHDLLDARFDDFNRWHYDDWVLMALRVDRKRLPKRLFQATLQRRCDRWCADKGVEHCPASVREELSDALSVEWYARALPTVTVTEAAWSLSGRSVWLTSLSDAVADRFRKRFLRSFGLTLVPLSPLDWLDADGIAALVGTAPEGA
jgi:recombination associated protein RdgC